MLAFPAARDRAGCCRNVLVMLSLPTREFAGLRSGRGTGDCGTAAYPLGGQQPIPAAGKKSGVLSGTGLYSVPTVRRAARCKEVAMTTQTNAHLRVLAIGLFCVFAPTLLAHAQEAHDRGPLKDVCGEGSRYSCGLAVRLCVSQDIEEQYDLTKTEINYCSHGANHLPLPVIPDAWAHVSLDIAGYVRGAGPRWDGYNFATRVVNFDSSMIKDGDVETAANKVQRNVNSGGNPENDAFIEASHRGSKLNFEKQVEVPSDIKVRPRETSVTDVCPTSWSRFSCLIHSSLHLA